MPDYLSSVLNSPIHRLDDEQFIPLDWFLTVIKALAETPTPTPKLAPFKLSTDTTSVSRNIQLLQNAGNDFAKIIADHQDTSLGYSSEFRLLEALMSIYKNHDTFPFFADLHQHEINYAFTRTLSDNETMAELNANIATENHQLVTKRPEILEEKLEREVNSDSLSLFGHHRSSTFQEQWCKLVAL